MNPLEQIRDGIVNTMWVAMTIWRDDEAVSRLASDLMRIDREIRDATEVKFLDRWTGEITVHESVGMAVWAKLSHDRPLDLRVL